MIVIRDIKDGECVPGAGAYRMSLQHYHTQTVCEGDSVSSTDLRRAYNSLHGFWKRWPGNPNRYPPKPEGDSLIIGRAAHCLMLGDEVFDDVFCFVPDDAPRRPTSAQVKAYERDGEWSEAAAEGAVWWTDFDKRSAGKLELRAEQVRRITYMSESLAANPLCVELLKTKQEMIEVSMIWQDEQTGLWIKSRPDAMPSSGYDFSDLKTFAPKGTNLILGAQRAVTDYDYAMQMALASMGAKALYGQTANNCGLCFAQTTEPYEAIPILLSEDTLYWAKIRCREAMNKIARGLATNDWPGVGADLTEYSYPPSMTERMAELQANGELPNE